MLQNDSGVPMRVKLPETLAACSVYQINFKHGYLRNSSRLKSSLSMAETNQFSEAPLLN